ncbi:MAG: heparinase II/III family protein [Opitutaceae bacterium]|nr:heparinase II/III family protein [Opitutaceae bacterium]
MSSPENALRIVGLGLLISAVATLAAEKKAATRGFPATRAEKASFSRPDDGATADLSPPGFSWWRAAPRGQATYRLKVIDERGRVAYESLRLDDPVHVPDKVLPAGSYTWTVEALDAGGKTFDTFGPRHFSIAAGAIAQPWVPVKELLARVEPAHPRILFPRAKLAEIRATFTTTRREAFAALQRQADSALKLDVPPEPDYDKLPTRAEQRLGYHKSFGEMRRYHTSGMPSLALMYALSGERKYGEHAKALLLGATAWDPEGISSIMSSFGDEIGLGLVKSEAQTFDWIHDLLSPAEDAKARQMLIARADQMMRRLEKRDYLANPEESHAGRLPGYLLEHAIALAEEPRAAVWLDYALRALTTVHPHWAGFDGGWAEGLSYGLSYNTTSMAPFEALRVATGFDLWQRPAHRKLRHFFVYTTSPVGEIFGFGDSFDSPVAPRASTLRGLLEFHAQRYEDPVVRGWVDLLRSRGGGDVESAVLPALMMPCTIKAQSPETLPPDAVFHGVGWAALHSNLAKPADDLLILFKSSPYGGVSHSYCDQNGFEILKGGRALALPGGSRYPQHGTPFHTEYTQQTRAQNAILVNGKGQVRAGGERGGRIAAFESTAHLGYVCGDATAAYGGLLKVARRHVLLVRPDVIVMVDDLEAPEPSEFQWLLHAWEKLELDERGQTLVSNRDGASLRARMFTTGRMSFTQSDAWPVEPKKGFPTARAAEPAKRWHFSASTDKSAAARRIASVMTVGAGNEKPDCRVREVGKNVIEVESSSAEGVATVRIDLSTTVAGQKPILEVEYRPKQGSVERITAR